MHTTFDAILEQKGFIVSRRAMYRQNVCAVQLQCRRQCSEHHPLRWEQLIIFVPHGSAEFLARSLGDPAVMVSPHRRQLQAFEPLECLARP